MGWAERFTRHARARAGFVPAVVMLVITASLMSGEAATRNKPENTKANHGEASLNEFKLQAQLPHVKQINSVSASQNSKFIVTGSEDSTLKLWDAKNLKLLCTIVDHQSPIEIVEFSPDSTQFASVESWKMGSPGVIKVWDTTTCLLLRTIFFRGEVFSLTYSPNSKLLAVTGWTTNIYNSATGQIIHEIPIGSHTPVRQKLSFSKNSESLTLVGPDSNIIMYHLESNRTHTLSRQHRGDPITCLKYSPDQKKLIIGTYGGNLEIWDITTEQLLHTLIHGHHVQKIEFLQNGEYFFSTGVSTQKWATETGKFEYEIYLDHGWSKDISLIDNDSKLIVTNGNHIDIRQTSNGKLIDSTTLLLATEFAFSSSNIFTSSRHDSQNQIVQYFTVDAAQLISQLDIFKVTNQTEVFWRWREIPQLIFSDDFNRLALVFPTEIITTQLSEQRNTATTNTIWTTKNWKTDYKTFQILFSDKSTYLLLRSKNENSLILNATTGEVVIAFDKSLVPSSKKAPSFSDHLEVVYRGDDVLVTNKLNPEQKTTIIYTGKAVESVSLSSNSKFIVIEKHNLIELRDLNTGTIVDIFEINQNNYISRHKEKFAYSQNGHGRLTYETDKNYVRYSVINDESISKIFNHSSSVHTSGFTPDKNFALVSTADGKLNLWEIATEKNLATFISDIHGNWTITTPSGRFDAKDLEQIETLHWVRGMKALPIESFMREYYEPNLWKRIMDGETFPEIRDLNQLNTDTPDLRFGSIAPKKGDATEVSVTLTHNAPAGTCTTQEGDKHANGTFDIRVFRNRQMVAYRDGRVDDTTLTFDVALPQDGEEEVLFSAYAFNCDGVKSETQFASYEIPEPPPPAKGRAYVLSMGVNDFENPAWNLDYAVNDAVAFQKHLPQILGANTERFSDVVPISLEDGQATKAILNAIFDKLAGKDTDEDILSGIKGSKSLSQATPQDALFITFSTHGFRTQDGEFYLFGHDIGRGSTKVLPELGKLISTKDLRTWMRDIDAGDFVMVVDACNSAASVQQAGFKPGPMSSRGLGQLAFNKKMRIIAASQGNEEAEENAALQQGVLSYALLQEGLLAGWADTPPQDLDGVQTGNRDGQIEMSEWLAYAQARVPSLVEEARENNVRPSYKGDGSSKGPPQLVVGDDQAQAVQTPQVFDFAKERKTWVLKAK